MAVDYISVSFFNNDFNRKNKGYNGCEISDENIFTFLDLEHSTQIGQLARLEGQFNQNYEYEIIEEEHELILQAKHFNEEYVKRFCFMYFVTMLKTQEPIINWFVEKLLNFEKEKR
jgi:hypothetical protein